MINDEKKLVIKDILGRLPYVVFVKENRNSLDDGPVIYTYDYHPYISNCKPYLRPMSSMTREEAKEYITLLANTQESTHYIPDEKPMVEFVDWLNKKMFDYRGLIGKGLALPAKEGMYKNI